MKRKWRPICLIVSIVLMLTGCSSPSPHLPGYLYAFTNNEFTVTNLNTGKLIARVTGPKTVNFRYAAKIDDNTILLSGSSALPNGRSVSVKLDGHIIQFVASKPANWLYNRSTGELTSFPVPSEYSSLGMPAYLPKHKSIVFYCRDNQLCRMSLDDPDYPAVGDISANLDKEVGDYGYYPIVTISNDEVVYATNNSMAKYYNLSTGQVGYLPFKKKCVPLLWRSKTQQLLCFVYQPKPRYYFIRLDGMDMQLAVNFDGWPNIYFPDYDTALAGGLKLRWYFPDPVPHEWSILRSYNLMTGAVDVFASGSWEYVGGAVWFSNVPKVIPGIAFAATASASEADTEN
ncbi:MAG: hypothetical protein WCC11_00025 [Gammaproteobacteria bacterium]